MGGVIKFKIDTGADVTVIGADQLEVFGLKKEQLKKNSRTLTGPDHNKLKCIGYFSTDFKVQEKNTQVIVYVCENIRTALLGRPALEDFQLVQIDIPSQVECSSVDKDSSNEFIEEFPKLFTGLGKIEGEYYTITKVQFSGIRKESCTPLFIFLAVTEQRGMYEKGKFSIELRISDASK